MGKTLTGIGSTAREKLISSLMDRVSPGHTSLNKQFYRGVTPMGVQGLSEVTLKHWSGTDLIMCGFSTCNGQDVCGA